MQSRSIAAQDIVKSFTLVMELRAFYQRQADEVFGCVNRAIDPLPEMLDALAAFYALFEEHTHPPGGVTSGKREVAHKASVLAYSYALELPRIRDLPDFFATFRSHTSDMGLELSLPDFSVGHKGPAALLPYWMKDDMVSDGPTANEAPAAPAAPASGGDSTLLPKALTVAGMQHIVFNLLTDVDKELVCFEHFWPQLKNLESFLKIKENRDRFIVTCLEGTAHADKAKLFKLWSATLYEQRWHEVAKFLHKTKLLLPVLAVCFDAVKYDSIQEGAKDKTAPFDVHMLQESVRSPMFLKTASMILAIHQVPEDLAAWAERCPCHECFFFVLNDYAYKQTMNLQFGKRCPANGCRAPELAAGELQDYLQALWDVNVADMLSVPSCRGPLAEPDRAILVADLEKAKAHITLQLSNKLAYWLTLPHILCGLAHFDETVARKCGAKALLQWQEAEVADLHHRITVEFFRNDILLKGLIDFVDGVPLAECSQEFQQVVYEKRWIPLSETTIEEKHARVNLDMSRRRGGPVKVSLANRAGILEERFRRDEGYMQKLLKNFGEARRIRHLASQLGIDGHPALVSKMPSWSTRKTLVEVIYRVDLPSLFESKATFTKESRATMDRQKRRAAVAMKVLGDANPVPVDESSVLRAALVDHFRKVASTSCVYQMPHDVSSGALQNLGGFFQTSAAAARRLKPPPGDRSENQDGSSSDGFIAESETCLQLGSTSKKSRSDARVSAEDPDGPLFFKVLAAAPGTKKTVRQAAASRRFAKDHIAVTLHRGSQLEDGTCVITVAPIAEAGGGGGGANPVHILSSSVLNPKQLQDGLIEWTVGRSLQYTLPCPLHPPIASELVTTLVTMGSFPDCQEEDACEFDDDDSVSLDALRVLENLGFVGSTEQAGRPQRLWRFTAAGAKAVVPCYVLVSSSQFFAVDVAKPLTDAESTTTYQALMVLMHNGWRWQQWIPPSSRPKRLRNEFPTGYRPGSPKILFSPGTELLLQYLLALLRAEDAL